MTNLLFQRIQIPDIMPVNPQKRTVQRGLPRLLVAFGVVILVLLAVGAALVTNTGQDRQYDNTTSQDHAQPLDLFP